jgi:hypothetical protein
LCRTHLLGALLLALFRFHYFVVVKGLLGWRIVYQYIRVTLLGLFDFPHVEAEPGQLVVFTVRSAYIAFNPGAFQGGEHKYLCLAQSVASGFYLNTKDCAVFVHTDKIGPSLLGGFDLLCCRIGFKGVFGSVTAGAIIGCKWYGAGMDMQWLFSWGCVLDY